LAEKKKLYVAGWLNAAGGKLKAGETPEQAAVREVREEQRVKVDRGALRKVADIHFHFPASPGKDLQCHVFIAERWTGEPQESDEMGPPGWYPVTLLYEILDRLPPADRHWLPRVLAGESLTARFDLDATYNILDSDIQEVFRA
jgi:8-oxo-dGTP diphosphatase